MDIDPPSCVSAAVALPVTAGAEGGAPPEWALVELQGAVEPPAGTEEGADFTAGRLKLLPSGAVELTIGMHALTGTSVTLDKPVAVLEKAGGGVGDENAAPDAGAAAGVHYRVVGVVKRRLLFKARPQTLIGRK